ncbi:MAG: hypothetical protein R3E79_01120 [Caldilineaceae bacterium]
MPTTGTFPAPPPGPVAPGEGGEGTTIVSPTPDSFPQGEAPTPGPDLQGASPLPTPAATIMTTGSITTAVGTPAATVMSASANILSQTADLTTTVTAPVVTGGDSPLPTPTPLAPPPAADGVANPPYIALTATPTTEAIAAVPTFTPTPTGVPKLRSICWGCVYRIHKI